MDSYTVMIVPDHNARVRRYRVSSRRVRRALCAAAVLLLAGGAVTADWVRARLDTRELDALRAERATRQAELERLAGVVEALEGRLTRVGELERKVRVIADLPAPAERTVAPPDGLGGETEAEALPALSPEEAGLRGDASGLRAEDADLPAPEGPAGGDDPEGEPRAALDGSAAGPGAAHAARVASLAARARQLDGLAESRERSLAELVEGLRGKSRRLASTPSIWPTRGWVTSRFGYRTSPFTGRRQFHAGVDVAGRPGTPVVAPARGRVVFVGRKGPLGNTVILDHGYGVRTTFGHNSEVLVKRGERVERGQAIASLGSTGRSTGPHLHYAVQLDGRRVNPMNYILEE